MVIDKNEPQKSEPKKLLLTRIKVEPEALIVKVQSTKPKEEPKTTEFIRNENATDRTIFSTNIYLVAGVVQVNYSKTKSLYTHRNDGLDFFAFSTTSKEIKKQDAKEENKVFSSFFARPPPLV